MKNKIINILLLICFSLFLMACDKQDSSEQQKLESNDNAIKLAILSHSDFFPDRAVHQRIGLPEALAARLTERLTQSKRFQVLERTALRKVINEQQFGQQQKESFLDRSVNAATDNIDKADALTVAVTTSAADFNDLVKEYQNLGTTVGADYLVFAVLEKADKSSKRVELPYSESGRGFTQNKVDARLRLRIINAKTGAVAGAVSFRTQVQESLLDGQQSARDDYSTFDDLALLASNKILDITYPAQVVNSEPWVVNRGSNDGFKQGAVFNVVHEGKEIKDASGRVIGKIQTPSGQIKLVSVQDAMAIAEVLEGNIQVGDLLEIDAQQTTADSDARPRTEHANGRQNGKIRLAVGKIRINAKGKDSEAARQYQTRLTNDLLVKLTNTQRFDVLDRQEIDQIMDEKSFIALTKGQNIEDKLKEFDQADYLVFPAINTFDLRIQREKVPYVDEIQTRYSGVVNATLRIVDSHSGKLLAADKISLDKKLDVNNLAGVEDSYARLIDDFSTALVSQIMLRLYPVRIIGAISDSEFYINRGEDGGLLRGDVFDVLREGQVMIDPDTGVSMGKIERKIAKVRVENIEPSRSIVSLLDGGSINTGDILRPAKQTVVKAPKPTIRKPAF